MHFAFGEMRKRIAETLAIELEQISVKAKTSEKLGFIGRGEAIAVYAVALIEQFEAF